jgi:putative two-component system response regulator
MELQMYRKNLEKMVEIKTAQLEKTQDSILSMLSNVTAYRDNETGAHIKRTTYFADTIVKQMLAAGSPHFPMSAEYASNIVRSAKLHDIGKVAVPDNILLKPGRLTPEEFDLIKLHTTLGAQIIDDAMEDLGDSSAFLLVAREIIITHHEWWNGKGYPNAASGGDIPISGRVMAIADVYDALISERPYKKPLSHEEAMNIILEDTGTHFDPGIVEVCKPVFDIFPSIAQTYRDEHYQKRMLR